jgi:hypothetical protein
MFSRGIPRQAHRDSAAPPAMPGSGRVRGIPSEVFHMRKLVIASLLVAGVALSGVVLAQAAPKAAATKTEQAAPAPKTEQAATAPKSEQAAAPAAKKTMAHHHHAHKAMKMKKMDDKTAGAK